MSIDFDSRVTPSDDVLLRELDGEAVLLDLASGTYFGLDAIGLRFWKVLSDSPSIQGAFDRLSEEFDVEPETLRRDLSELTDKLVEKGLLVVQER